MFLYIGLTPKPQCVFGSSTFSPSAVAAAFKSRSAEISAIEGKPADVYAVFTCIAAASCTESYARNACFLRICRPGLSGQRLLRLSSNPKQSQPEDH